MDASHEAHVKNAHLFEEKARECGQKLKYNVAINYFACALSAYEKALECANNPEAIQSIKLEMEYTQKEKDMYKKQELEFEGVMDTLKMHKRSLDMEMEAGSDEEENEERTRVIYERMSAVLREAIEKKQESCRALMKKVEEAEAERDALKTAHSGARAAGNSEGEAAAESSSQSDGPSGVSIEA